MAKSNNSLIIYSKDEIAEMLGDLPFTDKQLNMLMAPTPSKFIHNRPIPGGGTADFVSGHYVMNVLNYVTAFQWNFEVLDEKIAFGQIIVRGQLSYPKKDGTMIIKTQYGRANIKYPKGVTWQSQNAAPLDYGNDFKAATTDALKKCASLAGVAWDIYGSEDIKQMKIADIPEPPKPLVPFEDIKMVVDVRLANMTAPDKLRFLKAQIGTINDKNLTQAQYEILYENLPKKKA